MDREKLRALLYDIGLTGGKWGQLKDSGDNIQFCCPFHGESRPSAGIHVEKEFGKCFGCGETFNLAKLVAQCMEFTRTYKTSDGSTVSELDYSKAYEWMEEKYNVERKEVYIRSLDLLRIEDDEEEEAQEQGRYEEPLVNIAPFRSGKGTHQYFFKRGFTKETAQKFKVGWDDDLMRITTPIFWRDGKLFGCIGRAVLNPKIVDEDGYEMDNPEFASIYKGKNFARYFIYNNAPIGEILFPLNFFELDDTRTVVLVEGQYDAMWLHQMGKHNVLSSITSKLSVNSKTQDCKQVDLLMDLGVENVILMRDNDEAGEAGNKHDYRILKDYFNVYGVTYPEGKQDPQQLTIEEYEDMVDNKYLFRKTKNSLKKIED